VRILEVGSSFAAVSDSLIQSCGAVLMSDFGLLMAPTSFKLTGNIDLINHIYL
jgi:hypothetical protein